MKVARIFNRSRDAVLCAHCEIADNLWTRTRGLMGRKYLQEQAGLFITPCPSIHMFWMKFSLDVVFVTKEMIVTDWVENIRPGQVYVARNHSGKPHAALELPAGTLARCEIQYGDLLEIV